MLKGLTQGVQGIQTLLDAQLWDFAQSKLLRKGRIKANPHDFISAEVSGKVSSFLAADDDRVYFRLRESARAAGVIAWKWSDGSEERDLSSTLVAVDQKKQWSLWKKKAGVLVYDRAARRYVHLENTIEDPNPLDLGNPGQMPLVGHDHFAQPFPTLPGVWRLKTGKFLFQVPRGHELCTFDRESRWVVTAHLNTFGRINRPSAKSLWIWDLNTRKAVHKLDFSIPLVSIHSPIATLAKAPNPFGVQISPSGDRLAVPSQGVVRLWDVHENRPLESLARPGHFGTIAAVAQHPAMQLIASGGEDSLVTLWNRADGRFIKQFVGPRGPISALAFSPDGKTLACSCRKGTILLSDLAGARLWTYSVEDENVPVTSLAFHPAGTSLAGGTADGRVLVLDVIQGAVVASAKIPGTVHAVAFTESGKRLAGAGSGGHVHVWDCKSLEPVQQLATGEQLTTLAFTSKDRFLVTGGNTVRFWSVSDGREVFAFEIGAPPVQAIALNPSGDELVIADQSTIVRRISLTEVNRRLGSLGLALP